MHSSSRRPLPSLVPLAVAAAALALGLAGCGGGDDDGAAEAPATAPPVAPTTGEVADGGASAAADACALLDPDVIEGIVSFEFGGGTWSEGPASAPGSCSWSNDEQLTTISVEVRQGIAETLDGLSAGTGTELEEVPVGAASATGVRDTAADRLISLYVPAGADAVVKVSQSPLKVDDEAMVALAEAAALAYENLPDGETDGSGGTSEEAAGDLRAVRLTVQSADAGVDLELEVTADEVRAAGNPVVVGITCAGAEPGDGGLFEGVYVVNATDLGRDPGLVTATVEATEPVDGPGTYAGTFSATDSQERSVEVDGELTIDAGLRSGELIGADRDGNQVAVTWECRPLA